MTLEIILAADEEARLRERAAAAGLDIQTFAREALIEKIDRPTFAELLAPVHEATRRSGQLTLQIFRLTAAAGGTPSQLVAAPVGSRGECGGLSATVAPR